MLETNCSESLEKNLPFVTKLLTYVNAKKSLKIIQLNFLLIIKNFPSLSMGSCSFKLHIRTST